MKFTHKIIWNRYIITILLFAVWMLFFDQNNVFRQIGLYNDLKTAEHQKEFYITEYKKDSAFLEELNRNPELKEKFARENYLMKKDDEVVFKIVREE